MDEPQIIKEYENVYFIYKPPYWNCSTPNSGVNIEDFIKKYDGNNLVLKWIKNNIKLPQDLIKKSNAYGLLNRLDYETSGIIMVAKKYDYYLRYRKNINDHEKTLKIYITVVKGNIEHQFGIIALPLYKNEKTNKITVNETKGKFSYTEYIKINTYMYDNNIYTLLVVKIKTGRTHQIRVHMKSIGHIIMCDKIYETDKSILSSLCDISTRLFLHAVYYKLENDIEGVSALPKDLENALKKMKIVHKYMTLSNSITILKSNTITDKFIQDNLHGE